MSQGYETVAELPGPEHREALAKADTERLRITQVILAQADGWRLEVARWLSETDPQAATDIIAEHVREPTARAIAKYLSGDAKPEIVSTGFADLDDKVSLEPGSLVIVGARSGRGKSALALQMALNVGTHARGGASLYFTSEMPSDRLMARGMCMLAKVDLRRVKRGLVTTDEHHRLFDACKVINSALAWMVDKSGLDVQRIRKVARAEVRRIERECGRPVKAIVVDYLQRVKAGKAAAHNANREQQVAAVATELKELAMELNLCVIAPAQLNKEGDHRKDDRPSAADMRESANIENEADVILLIHNPGYHERQRNPEHDASQPEACEVIIAKGREDGTGTVPIWFTPMYTRFGSMSTADKVRQREESELAERQRARGKR